MRLQNLSHFKALRLSLLSSPSLLLTLTMGSNSLFKRRICQQYCSYNSRVEREQDRWQSLAAPEDELVRLADCSDAVRAAVLAVK